MIDHAGQLDRRITIQSFTTTTDDFGQKNKSFGTLVTVWAKVVEAIGTGNGEGNNGDMISATKRVDFFIRYRSDINEQMQIVYNNKTYKIHAIQSADAREAFQMIRCEYTDAV
jgi:SPP1 family predicted phage head-tail adaptor